MKSKRKILIVDDHAIVREGLRSLIDRQPDLRVSAEAESVAEALRACEQSRPDAVVVDLTLGTESGLDLLAKWRADYRDLPILVLSIHSEELYAERVLRSGASGYVMKQEATTLLLSALRRILDGGTFVSESISDRILRGSRTVREPAGGVETLTNRELEVFRLLGAGLGTVQIAAELRISRKTVETHRARIKERLGIESATGLVVRAVRWADQDAKPGLKRGRAPNGDGLSQPRARRALGARR